MAAANSFGLPFDGSVEEQGLLRQLLDEYPNLPVHAFIVFFYLIVFGYFLFVAWGFIVGL
ncbi:hypothetical protein [Halopiger goleimassiliensis]|uniref:hypothetical protein n=1 Tax=Halopiger goleimassiliensis TaxID=1293048 RepID=UPI0006780403|nr:hypothetical protein [Halopiger goleimassiliensis]